MERVLVTIQGMSCSHCVRAVDGALREVQGVRVEVGSAVLANQPDAVTPSRLAEVVAGEGYEVRGIARAS